MNASCNWVGQLAAGQFSLVHVLRTNLNNSTTQTFGAEPFRTSLTCEHSITWPSCGVNQQICYHDLTNHLDTKETQFLGSVRWNILAFSFCVTVGLMCQMCVGNSTVSSIILMSVLGKQSNEMSAVHLVKTYCLPSLPWCMAVRLGP